VALNAAKNAGILAATIIGAFDKEIGEKIVTFKKGLDNEVLKKVDKLKKDGWDNQFD
jgi:5-(carboxyamino)imidazole ribonucleotide mutase